jgi:AcrR family transcriptional regulator
MAIRQRAIQAEDKAERQQGLLDAAARLLLRVPGALPSVADVAAEAGLAKGTVYLYFPGKDEMLLALHERNVDAFFRALAARLDGPAPVDLDGVLALIRAHLCDAPLFRPLASRCSGLMAQAPPLAAATAFRQRLAERLQRAGAGIERRFPSIAPGGGRMLLRHSYALALGLWQMAGAQASAAARAPGSAAFDDADDLDRALRSLWRGAIGASTHDAAPRDPRR